MISAHLNIPKGSQVISFIAVAFFISSCASLSLQNKSCRLKSDATPELSALFARGCEGDRQAFYEIGRVFEEGAGIRQDLDLAASYYRAVSTPRSTTQSVYVPSAAGVPAMMLPVDREWVPAIPDAQYRLGMMYIDGRGVKPDREKAIALLSEAADAGHIEAAEALSRARSAGQKKQ